MNHQTPVRRSHFAEVEIKGEQVYSRAFDDIYFSREDGVAESRYVFLQGNDLPEIWQEKHQFCIAETGFGSGLNFLLTLQAWRDDPHHCKQLDYYAIEGFPLRARHLQQLHLNWPELASLSSELIRHYPPIAHGTHSLHFQDGRVRLHLIFDEVANALQAVDFTADCWFLDGFAPAKNPQMWRPEILTQLAAHARPGTRLATFTAAGAVRRNLIAAGFEISKRKGFGRKREMLCGVLHHPERKQQSGVPPWFSPAPAASPSTVAVIGAGIAGAQIARHLAQRGSRVSVFESNTDIAQGASGNRAGILAPKLSATPGLEEDFYLAAFLYQLRQLDRLRAAGHPIDFEQYGLLQIAQRPADQHRLGKLAARRDLAEGLFEALSAEQLTEKLGENSLHPGYLIRMAGSLFPASLCRALLDHRNISVHCEQTLLAIQVDMQGPVLKISHHENSHFDAIVLANGYQATAFSDTIRLIPVRGQSSQASLKAGAHLKHAIAHGGYVAPYPDDPEKLIFGATHLRDDCDTRLRPAETAENRRVMKQSCPTLAKDIENIEDAHAATRAATPDRMPLLGALPDAEFYGKAYADLSLGKHYKRYPDADYHRGVYLLSGLGSRGLCTAAYCANLLAHIICDGSAPASSGILHSLHPGRFLIREYKKRG